MEKIFSQNKVNLGRQIELDIARGLAITFMVLVHVLELFTATPFPKNLSTYIIRFLGSPPAAPVFMLLLGVGIVYSKRSTPAYLFKRGIIILILGYALAFSREIIPTIISYLIYGDAQVLNEGFLEFLGIDILQFAGLVFLFFALVLKLKLKTWHIALLPLIFSTFGILLKGLSTGTLWGDALAGFFWGSWERSWFPFFSWIFFPVAGYLFGTILMHCQNKTQMYKIILFTSGATLIPFIFIKHKYNIEFGIYNDLYEFQYFHQDLFGNIVFTIFVLFWISLIYFLTLPFKNLSFSTLKRWSKNVNQIYITHWIILCFLHYIFIREPLNLWSKLILAVLVLIASDIISTIYLKLKANFIAQKKNKKE